MTGDCCNSIESCGKYSLSHDSTDTTAKDGNLIMGVIDGAKGAAFETLCFLFFIDIPDNSDVLNVDTGDCCF